MRPTLAASGLMLAADQADVVAGFIVFGVGMVIGLVSALIIERITKSKLDREYDAWVAAGRPERRGHPERRSHQRRERDRGHGA